MATDDMPWIYRGMARAAGIQGDNKQLEAAGRAIASNLGKLSDGRRAAMTGQKPPKRERRIELAKRHGYTGSDDELAAKGREIRRAVRRLSTEDREQAKTLTKAEMDQLIEHGLDDVVIDLSTLSPAELAEAERDLNEAIAWMEGRSSTPLAPDSAPAPALGLQPDGSFLATTEQLRDPQFCVANGAHMSRVQIVDGLDPATTSSSVLSQPQWAGKPVATDAQLRDPAWCYENQALLQRWAMEVSQIPLPRAAPVVIG